MDKLRFISLASGSSGNCYFVGNQERGILIDAGIGVRTIKKRLKEVGVDFSQIMAVFVTHDHSDHIKAVGPLGEKHHIPIYATKQVHDGIAKSYVATERLSLSRKEIELNYPISIFDFHVIAFAVSHDASECVGYTVVYHGKRFTVATDLGYICENAAKHIKQANYLVIEANYDEEMLEKGCYPQYLKQRIKGANGHLCNNETASFLAEYYQPHLACIYLCHLSKDNNTPELAYDKVAQRLFDRGVEIGTNVQLHVLPRTSPTELFIYE